MKSLLIATGVLSALVMTGCATNKDQAPTEKPAHEHKHKGEHHKKFAKKPSNMTKSYTCDNNATVKANYSFKDKNTVLNITAPTLGLNAQDVTLTHVKKDKPSLDKAIKKDGQARPAPKGFEFINETNANAKYHWNTFGKDATLSVTTPNTTHTITCQDDLPMPQRMPPKKDAPKPADIAQ